MKVVVSIRQRSFARFVAFDLAEAARRLGWTVHWVDFDALTQGLAGSPVEAWRAALAEVADGVRAFAPDIVLSYGVEAILPPFPTVLPDEPWRLADLTAAPVACFFYDFGAPFDRPVDAVTRPYIERLQQADVRVFCWDRQALDDLGRFGVAAEYLPMAVNEAMFFPPPAGAVRDLPIVFSGGPTPDRVAALRPLADMGLSVFGYDEGGWTSDPTLAACYRGIVTERDRLRDLYQRARIAVNITRAHGRASLNMRVFEAMACGCLVVTDQAEEASTLFDVEHDLVTVPPGSPLTGVVGRYLRDDAGRATLAERGAAAVSESHTYVARLAAIAPRLKAFVAETRAWSFWERFMLDDPGKALRFVESLRADRTLLREDLWHLGDAIALMRLERWVMAGRSLERAERLNPALLRVRALTDALRTHQHSQFRIGDIGNSE